MGTDVGKLRAIADNGVAELY